MKPVCSLEEQPVQQMLDTLHSRAKGDWKVMLKVAPRVLWGMIRRESMMKSLTPELMKNAYIPVSREQGRFLYSIARSIHAKHIIEFGTSFGIGTIYLAAAAKDNGGKVITTEIEPAKCQAATENLRGAGLEDYFTLLEGDALQTLKQVEPGIDLVFLDGWKDIYNDVLDLLLPKLRDGAVVIGDNIDLAEGKDFLARVSAPGSGFLTTVVNKATSFSCYIGK